MKPKANVKQEVDPNPIEFYDYINDGYAVWLKNPDIKPKVKVPPETVPYITKKVQSKDNAKRIITFTDKSTGRYMDTLPIINGKELNVDDMSAVKDINEVELLYNIMNRLEIKKTFTNVGPTLLITNPFCNIEGIYGQNQIENYIAKQQIDDPDTRLEIKDPHLYDLVLIAIKELLKPGCRNQALVVSGESGAGKTVATKNSMECVTYYFGKNSPKKENEDPLEKQILDCNPILEAFGNAKTVRNDNSSRFGKYVKIKLNKKTNIIEGAEIVTYLLEKSRISELNELERNYHAFYFLLNSGDDKLLSSLYLTSDITKYKYLFTGDKQVTKVPTIDDHKEYQILVDCFKSTGFTQEDLTTIFKVIAAVLLFGNIEYKVTGDKLELKDPKLFANISELLGVDSEFLLTVLSRKPPMLNETKYGGLYPEAKIKNFIDAIAKELYNRLFLWIVTKLNKKLDSTSNPSESKYIGLLDIFGFECFARNSIEQLCINYTNEQLQQLYIKDIFENDKKEFVKEGLDDKLYLLNATYKDNKDVIRLIKTFFNRLKDCNEDKQVYSKVEQILKEIKNPPKTDKRMQKVKEEKIQLDKLKKEIFKVCHTAKDVEYTIENFVEKNKDETKDGVVDCLFASTNLIVQQIFTNTTTKEKCDEVKENTIEGRKKIDPNKVKNRYLGMKFCEEMKNLKTELKACDHHYIRCIKPNEDKKALVSYPCFVFNQIQYLGILATIQVRKSGFPVRRYFMDFYDSYKIILKQQIKIDPNTEMIEVCKSIIVEMIGEQEFKKQEENCLFGRTKIYMKQSFSSLLEKTKVVLLKEKTESSKKMYVSVDYFKKLIKVQKIRSSVFDLQTFFNGSKYKIIVQKKKANIKKIQAAIKTKFVRDNFKKRIKNYITIQNCARILAAKKRMKKDEFTIKFLSYQLQLYLYNMRIINKIKMKRTAAYLLERCKDAIVYREYAKLWNNVKPYFQMFLMIKKNNKMVNEARRKAKAILMLNSFHLFEERLFFKKIKDKKRMTKNIFSFASAITFSNYYIQMRNKILIIQQYYARKKNIKVVIDKVNRNYFKNTNRNCIVDNNNPTSHETENLTNLTNRNNIHNINNNNNLNKNNNLNYLNTINDEDDFNYNTNPNYNKKYNNYLEYLNSKTIMKYSKERDNMLLLKEQNDNNVNNNTISFYNRMNTINASNIPKSIYTNNFKYQKNISTNLNYCCLSKTYNPNNCIYPNINIKEPKIYIFAKILDIDIISDDTENSNTSWYNQFMHSFRESLMIDNPIEIIKIHETHTIVLTLKGKMYTWGWNNNGQCGLDPNQTSLSFLVKFARDKETGKYPVLPVLNYKYSRYKLDKTFNDIYISKVCLGEDYSFAIDSKGNLYSFGNNDFGQLGKGNLKKYSYPTLLKDFKEQVYDIKTTGCSNIIITKYNNLYIWYPSLNDNLIIPTRIYIDKKIIISNISVGKNFAIILTTNGVCYGLGSNEQGELGLDGKDFRMTIEEIFPLSYFNTKIIQVRCGFKHIICLGIDGNVYGWGNNSYGQLGDTNKNSKNVMKLAIDTGYKIIQIAAGFRNSFFFNENREIFYCGMSGDGVIKYNATKFNILDRCPEYANDSEFSPVRIMCTFNRNISIFYVSLADIRGVYTNFHNNVFKINNILNNLAQRWINEDIKAPFIPNIESFFLKGFMKSEPKSKK